MYMSFLHFCFQFNLVLRQAQKKILKSEIIKKIHRDQTRDGFYKLTLSKKKKKMYIKYLFIYQLYYLNFDRQFKIFAKLKFIEEIYKKLLRQWRNKVLT